VIALYNKIVRKKKKKTFHIQWHITERCNLRCKHCYQDTFDSRHDLSPEDAKEVLANLFTFLEETDRRLTVDITGGEPFLFPSFYEILETLNQSELVERIGLITNGTFLDRKTIEHLSSYAKLSIIKISCEAVERRLFEEIRGQCYEKFLSAITTLNTFPREKYLIFTLMEQNKNQVPGLFSMCEEFCLDGFILERFFPMGAGRKIMSQSIHTKTWREIGKYLLKRCGLPADINLIAPYRGFLLKRDKNGWDILGADCVIGKYGCAILNDGSVFPCRRFPVRLGSALEEPFSEIWQRHPFRKMSRKKLGGRCGRCNIRGCYGCRALAYCVTKDMYAQDPLCFLC